MRFALLFHYPELGAAGQLDDAAMAEGQRAFGAFTDAATSAGVLVAAEVLQPTSATVTQSPGPDGVTAKPGPAVESAVPLGGWFVLEVADQDAALAWAAKAPSAQWGPIEVRPIATHVEHGAWV